MKRIQKSRRATQHRIESSKYILEDFKLGGPIPVRRSQKREGGDGLVMAGFGTDINNTEFVVTCVSFCPVLKLWSRSIVLPYAFSFQFLFWSFPKKTFLDHL